MPPSPPLASPLAITGLGMVSSLGHDVVASCAAARAGLLAPVELKSLATDELFGPEGFDGPPTVSGHAVPGIGEGFAGMGKAIELGAAALADLLARRALSEREQARTGVYVAVSDHFVQDAGAEAEAKALGASAPGQRLPSARWRDQAASLPDRLLERAGIRGVSERAVTHAGHAGFVACLAEAAEKIHRGAIDRAIVGGVDSRIEPGFVKAAALLRALKTKDNAVGITPGEAAAFVLLERPSDAHRLNLEVWTQLVAVASARDPAHHFGEAPANGAVLADVIARVAASPELRGRLGLFIGDMNGTERRALDWGHALMRLRARLESDVAPPLWLPAASFGDTGAATGAVGVCLAARGFDRGYAPEGGVIVWLSSESGEKGAFGLVAPRRG